MSIFSHKDSLKWAKYLMLVQFGFVKRQELEQDIRRYRRAEAHQVIRDIAEDLRAEKKRGQRFLYVIKLVTLDISGRLPNFRVERTEDLQAVPRFFAHHAKGDHAEIWFCRTRVDEQIFSVAGRFVFTPRDSAREQSVEQVWRSSPRLLEQVSRNSRFPYVRASRYSWGWPFSIEEARPPKHSPLGSATLVNEFHESMRLFERQRDSIEVFLTFLNSFGYRAYSLEYKIVGTKLTIIDWDTPDDRLVLASTR